MQIRKFTNMIIDAMDEGMMDPRDVADMCLAYMSEANVEDMAAANDLFQEDEDFDDSMDGDAGSALASAGWGTDEDYGSYGEE
jgi:hypothetical protein